MRKNKCFLIVILGISPSKQYEFDTIPLFAVPLKFSLKSVKIMVLSRVDGGYIYLLVLVLEVVVFEGG